MIEVRQAAAFREWHRQLRDDRAVARIATRIRRVQLGNSATSNLWAMAWANCGSTTARGIGFYFVRRGHVVVVLLCGGDKRTQDQDIARAKEI